MVPTCSTLAQSTWRTAPAEARAASVLSVSGGVSASSEVALSAKAASMRARCRWDTSARNCCSAPCGTATVSVYAHRTMERSSTAAGAPPGTNTHCRPPQPSAKLVAKKSLRAASTALCTATGVEASSAAAVVGAVLEDAGRLCGRQGSSNTHPWEGALIPVGSTKNLKSAVVAPSDAWFSILFSCVCSGDTMRASAVRDCRSTLRISSVKAAYTTRSPSNVYGSARAPLLSRYLTTCRCPHKLQCVVSERARNSLLVGQAHLAQYSADSSKSLISFTSTPSTSSAYVHPGIDPQAAAWCRFKNRLSDSSAVADISLATS